MKGTALKAAATIGAAFSVKALANFSKQCLELGSDLQEVQNVVDVTFGNMSDKVNKFAQEAAKTSGLSETMAKKYAGTYGAMAKSFKFDPKATYDMSTALTTLTGDVASFYNLSQDEAYTKLKSVFTGETESLKDLGVVMTQTALDQYALANGFGKTTAAMTEQEKVSLRYKFVTEQLGAAAGDFIRTQDSWANQTRILSLQMESFKAAIGQGLINVLTPVIKWLNLLMEKLVAAANAFKTFTETLFGKQISGPTQTTSSTADLDAMASSADNATAATNKTTAAAKKLKRELAGFDQITKLGSEEESSGADTGTSASAGGTTTTTPSIDDGTADKVNTLSEKYGKLAKSVETLKTKFKGFTDLLSGAGTWVMDNVLEPLGNWTMNELAPTAIDALSSAFGFLTTALEFLKPVWDWIWKNFLKPIANFVGDAIIIALQRISGVFDVLTAALTVLKPIWDWIWKNLFEPIGKFVGDAFSTMLSTWAERLAKIPAGLTLLKQAIESLPGKIEEIKAKVKEKWDALLANVTGKLVDFGAKIATKWEDLQAEWDALKGNIQDKIANFKAKIATKWAELKEAWYNLKAKATGKTADIKAAVATKWKDLKGKWNNLLANFIDKTVSVTLKIKGKVADIKKWFNEKVIDKVNEKIHTVPILKGVNIPHLAQGGYVKKNTPQLAMIGDNRHFGEVVAPENKLQEMARMAAAGAGGTSPEVIALLREIVVLLKTLDLDVTVDGKSVMGIIVKLINQQTKSTGVCPITV
ncbi:MAG: hypothetical protein IKJ77_06430 [Firmicutes bacterium]|nr:hypothetical protein [Bacillota bacterium]